MGLAKNIDPNASLPSNGPLSHNLASTTPPRTNRRSAKRKGRKEKKMKKESSECSGVWRNGFEKKGGKKDKKGKSKGTCVEGKKKKRNRFH